MNKSLRLIVRIIASATLLSLIVWRTDWHKIGDGFARLNIYLWLLAAVLYVVAQVLSSLRWQFLARPLGYCQPFRSFVSFYFIGMFFNLVLPTSVGGDVVRAWYLASGERKLPDGGRGRRTLAFVSVLEDRLSGLLMLLLIACAAVTIYPLLNVHCPLPVWVPCAIRARVPQPYWGW